MIPGHIYRQGSAEYFLGGFEFRNLYFFGTVHGCCIFLGLLDKCCIFLRFHIFNSILRVQFYAPGTSVITVVHYYHIVLNFCQMNRVSGGYFSGFCFSESIYFGCSVSGKVFFRVVQKYSTPLIPVCRFIKSTPWDGDGYQAVSGFVE